MPASRIHRDAFEVKPLDVDQRVAELAERAAKRQDLFPESDDCHTYPARSVPVVWAYVARRPGL